MCRGAVFGPRGVVVDIFYQTINIYTWTRRRLCHSCVNLGLCGPDDTGSAIPGLQRQEHDCKPEAIMDYTKRAFLNQ